MLNSLKLWFCSIFYFIFKIPTLLNIKFTSQKEEKYLKSQKFLINYTKFALKLVNVNIIVDGKENLMQTDNHLFVANHSSILDPFLLLASTEQIYSFFIAQEFSFVEKVPLAKIPFNEMKNIYVPRDNLKKSINAIKSGKKILNNQKNLFIFPEGEITHLISNENVGTFKHGAFKTALTAQKSIIPISIIGSEKIQKKVSLFGKINSGTVKILIHKPIEFNFFKENNSLYIANYTQNIIKKGLDENII